MTAQAQQPSLSRRAFARQVGVSETVIRRLVGRGVLPVDAGGKLPMPAALHAFVQVRAVRDPAAPSSPPAGADEPSGDAAPAPRHSEVIETELARKRLGIRLQELRVGRESGQLVPRDQVAADAQATCGAIRAALLALPARVALLVEALVASSDAQLRAGRIQRLLQDEINLALEALNGARLGAVVAAVAAGGGMT